MDHEKELMKMRAQFSLSSNSIETAVLETTVSSNVFLKSSQVHHHYENSNSSLYQSFPQRGILLDILLYHHTRDGASIAFFRPVVEMKLYKTW